MHPRPSSLWQAEQQHRFQALIQCIQLLRFDVIRLTNRNLCYPSRCSDRSHPSPGGCIHLRKTLARWPPPELAFQPPTFEAATRSKSDCVTTVDQQPQKLYNRHGRHRLDLSKNGLPSDCCTYMHASPPEIQSHPHPQNQIRCRIEWIFVARCWRPAGSMGAVVSETPGLKEWGPRLGLRFETESVL